MSKLVIANWKMHPATETEAIRLARAEDRPGAVVVPPFPFLAAVRRVLRRAKLGAQDAFWERAGAYTGEISPVMLRRLGVRYVVLGHSERRRYLGETDAMVNRKLRSALAAGLTPVVCVGESLAIHRKGIAASKRFVERELRACLRGVSREHVVVAYEPIWSISTSGTGKVDTPESAAEMIRFLKRVARTAVIYGGSVNHRNAAGFLRHPDIDGALVGGASLSARTFLPIVRAARAK